MLLKKLIKNYPKRLGNLNIKGLALNSKDVKKGYIFFAIRGNKINGENFVNDAIKNGAVLIICSKKYKLKSTKKIHIIKTFHVKDLLSEATSKFYILKPKNIIAVTGTNGKTSVADFFYQILDINNIPVASIGTLGIRQKKGFVKTNLTSPDIITLHKNLENLKRKKIDNVIIEASSHGLDQKRLDNLNIKIGVFTNFSQDHLDYHKTMKAYLNSKLILFSKLLLKNRHVIADSSSKIFSILKKISKKKGLRLLDTNKIYKSIEQTQTPLIGSFQIKNLSMAVLAAKLCNLSEAKINASLKKINNVEGRLELIKKYPGNKRVFIDYAHTPEALSEVLKSLKSRFNSEISIVFGCGGERDFKKRPIMAKIAKNFCKKIYVTDDNPRKENPAKIRKEITKNLNGSNYYDIAKRSSAIKKAIVSAEPYETVLIAGKGHENYQDYGKKIISISDRKIIKSLKIKKNMNYKKQKYFFNSKILNMILKNNKFYKFNGITIDTRNLQKDNLFLAIKGKNRDGSCFIPEAIKKGARYAVSSKPNKRYLKKIIKVKDSNTFLNKFAKLKRENCKAKIIAVTGSAGKTSLKNILSNLLQNYSSTYSSPKSFNNHYGVPLSLSNLNLNHQFGVFEVGMNKKGEINKLSKILKPNLAIITNIAEAHIVNFKNIKGIAKAKSEIIDNIQENGTLVINRDDKFYNFLSDKAKRKKIKVISFGKSKNSDVHLLKLIKHKKSKSIFVSIKNEVFKIKLKNINIYNVLASIAVLKDLNLDLRKTLRLFENFQPSEGRGKVYKIKRYNKNFNLIDESYNANPFSVKNALRNFSEITKKKSKKYLLLGDMLELGDRSERYHKKLSQLINRTDIDKVFVKGEKVLFTYKNLDKGKRGNIFQCVQDVDLILKEIISTNDYLMIKGSNATGLNIISKEMIKGI